MWVSSQQKRNPYTSKKHTYLIVLSSHVFPRHISMTQRISFEIAGCLMPCVFALQEEIESTDGKAAEQLRRPKGPAPQIRQKPKKESKKKR